MEIINLILVAILIALTAFFVAAEFAIVKVRKTRIEQLIEAGNKKAIAAKRVVSHLDEYLSACQLGITVTALGLGWLGEPTVEHLLRPLFLQLELSDAVAKTLSFTIAFASITFLHVVLGELAPKTIAIQKAETVTLLFAKPLIWFYKIMYPFIWALNGSAQLFIRLFGLKPANEHEVAHSEEELRFILSESYESGNINQSEYKYVNKIFEFDERIAKEIMTPRTEFVALNKDTDIEKNIEIMLEENYTRYPVFSEDKDHVIGMIHMKEVLADYIKGETDEKKTVENYLRPIIHVVETIPIHDLLLKMQKERIHMAILVDEYGGTAGLVTVEDILEEIVGEIRDEFDIDEKPMIQKVDENKSVIDGKVLISEVNDLFGLELDDQEMDTLGGWILTKISDPEVGNTIQYEDFKFEILEMDGHQVKYLEISKNTEVS